MASNFHIVAKKSRNQFLDLRLFGDFDGSSACELINFLDESVHQSSKVAIQTDGLRTIDGFGLSIFLPRMLQLKQNLANIEVTGQFSGFFQEE